MWLSVDPLSDKYPNISSYAYCAWNPIKFYDPNGKEKHIFLRRQESYPAINFQDDSGIYIFAHGDLNGDIENGINVQDLPDYINSDELANYITDNSEQWKKDALEGSISMIFLYVCHAGEGDNNVAQQLSSILNDHETIVIGPIGVLESSADPRHQQEGQYSGVKNSKGNFEGSWGVYQNGKLRTTIRGYKVPTKATIKRQMFFDNLWKSIKNLFNHENE